jgi:hypothetical protein
MRLTVAFLLGAVLAGPVSLARGQTSVPAPPPGDAAAISGIDSGGTDHPSGPNLPPVAAPEPTTLTLGGMAIVGMAAYRWRQRRRTKPD